MATTKSDDYGSLYGDLYGPFTLAPIAKLRLLRKADCKPKKPKPVTDEQLLAIVDELEGQIQTLKDELAGQAKYNSENYKLKMFAPAKREADFFV